MKNGKLLTLFVILVYIFVFAPLLIIIVTSFGAESIVAFPPKGFSLKWFLNIFKSQSFMKTLAVSLQVSTGATLTALLIGVPAAYGLSRYEFKGKSIIKNFFFSPVIIPGVVVGFSLFQFIIVSLRFPVMVSLYIGHIIVIIPYIIRVIGSSLENFDYAIEEAAQSLGAPKWQTFFRVVFPNITSGVIAAFLLAFIDSFNNVPVSIFLTGPGVSTLPISMMSYVEYNYDPTVSALSVLMMVFTILIMFVVEKTLGLNFFSK